MYENFVTVTIVGGGPIGLAAAAHLKNSGISFVLLEQGNEVAANVRSWGHVRLFSPWKYNIDPCAKQMLIANGVGLPNDSELPTGHQLIDDYLAKVASLPGIEENIRLDSTVIAIGKNNRDKVKSKAREACNFEIQYEQHDLTQTIQSKFVIDATGTWSNPNPLGGNGYFSPSEKTAHEKIYYGIPDLLGADRDRYVNKNVLVVGSGHSAINTVLDLNQLRKSESHTRINWIVRKNDLRSLYGGRELDGLEARGQLGIQIESLIHQGGVDVFHPVFIKSIFKQDNKLTIVAEKADQPFELTGIEEIIVNAGSRPDFSFIREIRFDRDASLECVPALAPLIDPNIHSCGTVRPHGERELRQPEKNFYIVGSKSYGRAPTFLMAVGYEQIRSIVGEIRGDKSAARRIELSLPPTGVCNTDIANRCG